MTRLGSMAESGGAMQEDANWGPPPMGDIERGEATRWSEAEGRPFRFAGTWWTRDMEGRVGIWSEERRQWTTPDFLTMPFFMRRPP